LLAAKARALSDAGLERVTVSLDALDRQTLSRIGDAPVSPERILEGIDAAANAGLHPVKVNMLVRRGLNDHCVAPMAERFRHSGHVLRFIEYMDVGSSNGWRVQDVMPAGEILAVIDERWPLQELAPTGEGEVASRYRYRDGAGEIGLIHSISKPFCGGCTRLRLSAGARSASARALERARGSLLGGTLGRRSPASRGRVEDGEDRDVLYRRLRPCVSETRLRRRCTFPSSRLTDARK
jgi:GTP 3',8-cyclase